MGCTAECAPEFPAPFLGMLGPGSLVTSSVMLTSVFLFVEGDEREGAHAARRAPWASYSAGADCRSSWINGSTICSQMASAPRERAAAARSAGLLWASWTARVFVTSVRLRNAF